MTEAGKGSFLISGATMALRGGAGFSVFSPIKFALRSYGQSCFNAYAKKGIHVGHVVIDGVIDSPQTRPWGGNMQLQECSELAETFYQLHMQGKSVWSYEVMVSPNTGNVGMRM